MLTPKFSSRCGGFYLPPRNMDEGQQSQALREYVDALQHFDRTELNVAWTTVRDCPTTPRMAGAGVVRDGRSPGP